MGGSSMATRTQGRLTSRLISQESMRQALASLLSGADRYSVFLKTARQGGQTNTLTLFEDGIDLTNSLDPRLLRSRNVLIVIASKSGGAAEVNITSRRWEVLQDSPVIREKLAEFN